MSNEQGGAASETARGRQSGEIFAHESLTRLFPGGFRGAWQYRAGYLQVYICITPDFELWVGRAGEPKFACVARVRDSWTQARLLRGEFDVLRNVARAYQRLSQRVQHDRTPPEGFAALPLSLSVDRDSNGGLVARAQSRAGNRFVIMRDGDRVTVVAHGHLVSRWETTVSPTLAAELDRGCFAAIEVLLAAFTAPPPRK